MTHWPRAIRRTRTLALLGVDLKKKVAVPISNEPGHFTTLSFLSDSSIMKKLTHRRQLHNWLLDHNEQRRRKILEYQRIEIESKRANEKRRAEEKQHAMAGAQPQKKQKIGASAEPDSVKVINVRVEQPHDQRTHTQQQHRQQQPHVQIQLQQLHQPLLFQQQPQQHPLQLYFQMLAQQWHQLQQRQRQRESRLRLLPQQQQPQHQVQPAQQQRQNRQRQRRHTRFEYLDGSDCIPALSASAVSSHTIEEDKAFEGTHVDALVLLTANQLSKAPEGKLPKTEFMTFVIPLLCDIIFRFGRPSHSEILTLVKAHFDAILNKIGKTSKNCENGETTLSPLEVSAHFCAELIFAHCEMLSSLYGTVQQHFQSSGRCFPPEVLWEHRRC
ncbi:MAG: hypothetical protein MHM6MM_003922 [Cercozoa sp. M6MM]